MSLSKVIKYSAIGIGCIIFGELYYECVKRLRRKWKIADESSDINEAFFTRDEDIDSKVKHSILTQRIQFDRKEKTFRIAEILESLILSAKKNIYVAMYIFTSHLLADAMKKASRKGVKIYVIVDNSMESASNSQVQSLKESGIDMKICCDYTMHHKFCLIDVENENGKIPFSSQQSTSTTTTSTTNANNDKCRVLLPENGILITGSLNWTLEGLTSNYENIVITSNVHLIRAYTNAFNQRWNESRFA
jgi:phosphatidylserine/phosphatidylglycerophosphate/cardiolipin synthase-like enzyme